MVSYFIRSKVPVYGVGIIGFIMASAFYISDPSFQYAQRFLQDYTNMTMYTMIILTLMVHMSYRHALYTIKRRPEIWLSSLILNIVLWAYFASGLLLGQRNDLVKWMDQAIRTAAMQATSCLLAFWIVSACYRTFRAKSWETLVLMFEGLVICLATTPVGAMILPPVKPISSWIMGVASAGAGTGIYVGTGIGTISVAIRQILGIEKSYLGLEEQ